MRARRSSGRTAAPWPLGQGRIGARRGRRLCQRLPDMKKPSPRGAAKAISVRAGRGARRNRLARPDQRENFLYLIRLGSTESGPRRLILSFS